MTFKFASKLALKLVASLALCAFAGCAGGGGGGGGGGSSHGASGQSSEPINPKESREYKQALLRCHKTGGTRIVKITGKLRCF